MTYARCWRACWSLVVTVGFGLAELQLSPLVAVLAVVLLGSSTAVVILVVRAAGEQHHPDRGRVPPGRTVQQGVAWGAALLAAATVAGGSPPVALLLGVMAVTTCPLVVDRCRAAVRPPRAPADAGADDLVLTDAIDDLVRVVGRLSDADLCELWQATFWELREDHTGDERLTLVMVRQTCLDELGRRSPEGLRAWMSSGARASSSPDRFLHPPGQGRHDVA